MSREIRRIPPNWEHPRNDRGFYVPLFDKPFAAAAAEWKDGLARWERGERRSYAVSGTAWKSRYDEEGEYWEYDGNPPNREAYRPEWPEGAATHYQMYETCSEGTPISPAFATPEEVARWCADNGASAFGSMTASYEAWLAVALGRPSVGMVISEDGPQSGVQAFYDFDKGNNA